MFCNCGLHSILHIQPDQGSPSSAGGVCIRPESSKADEDRRRRRHKRDCCRTAQDGRCAQHPDRRDGRRNGCHRRTHDGRDCRRSRGLRDAAARYRGLAGRRHLRQTRMHTACLMSHVLMILMCPWPMLAITHHRDLYVACFIQIAQTSMYGVRTQRSHLLSSYN